MELDENPEEGAVPEQETASAEQAQSPEQSDAATSTPALPLLPGGELRVWAVLAHMLAIAGYMTGFGLLGWVGPLVIWIKLRKSDPFVAFHALQSLLFQLIWTGLLFVGIRLIWLMPEMILCWVLSSAVPVVWCVIAAIKAHQGEWYQYPLVGHWALDLTEQSTRES